MLFLIQSQIAHSRGSMKLYSIIQLANMCSSPRERDRMYIKLYSTSHYFLFSVSLVVIGIRYYIKCTHMRENDTTLDQIP